jgi:hypothetical protein
MHTRWFWFTSFEDGKDFFFSLYRALKDTLCETLWWVEHIFGIVSSATANEKKKNSRNIINYLCLSLSEWEKIKFLLIILKLKNFLRHPAINLLHPKTGFANHTNFICNFLFTRQFILSYAIFMMTSYNVRWLI